jgi:hypothetical protein
LLIGGFNKKNKVGNEIAIRLPKPEHEAVTAAQKNRGAMASARDLLASDIWLLRNLTKAPRAALAELIKLSKELHTWDYVK